MEGAELDSSAKDCLGGDRRCGVSIRKERRHGNAANDISAS